MDAGTHKFESSMSEGGLGNLVQRIFSHSWREGLVAFLALVMVESLAQTQTGADRPEPVEPTTVLTATQSTQSVPGSVSNGWFVINILQCVAWFMRF